MKNLSPSRNSNGSLAASVNILHPEKNDNAGWDLNPAEDKPCKVCLNLGAYGSFCREDHIQVNSLLGAPDKISLSDE